MTTSTAAEVEHIADEVDALIKESSNLQGFANFLLVADNIQHIADNHRQYAALLRVMEDGGVIDALQEEQAFQFNVDGVPLRDHYIQMTNLARTLAAQVEALKAERDTIEAETGSVTPEYALLVLKRTLIPLDKDKRAALMSLISALEKPDFVGDSSHDGVIRSLIPTSKEPQT